MSVNTTLLAVVVNQNTKADNQYYPADVPTDYSWYGGAKRRAGRAGFAA